MFGARAYGISWPGGCPTQPGPGGHLQNLDAVPVGVASRRSSRRPTAAICRSRPSEILIGMDVGSAESSFAHVELIRDAFDAVKSGDWEAATRFLARDATWESGFGNYRGRAEIERFWREWVGSFDEFDFVLEETADLGGGVLFVAIQLTGRPLGAGGSVQTRQGCVVCRDIPDRCVGTSWTLGGLCDRLVAAGGVECELA